MQPEWEKLAAAVKGTIKVAYFDTEQQTGRRPALLGEIQGTPTIRFYKPKPKQGKSNSKKIVLDYQYERKVADMKRWADEQMPNFVEAIRGTKGLTKFQEKAKRNGLPQVILFASKARTSSLTKYLSTEFRRRLLLGEVYPTKTNQEVLDQFQLDQDKLPVLLVIPANGTEPIFYEGEGFSRMKLYNFMATHALSNPVFPTKKKSPEEDEKQQNEESNEAKPVHTEL